MKVLLLLGFIAGFAGVFAGAHHLPWGAHERVPSKTAVQPNGGRLEQFVIRLPADRIDAATESARGSARRALAAAFAEQPLELEHFKLRDVDGQVIGIAARHRTVTPTGAESAWWLVIPGRGAMLLGAAETAPTPEQALATAGWREGSAWSGEVDLARVPRDSAARIVAGNREFAQLEGQYSERWRITGVSEGGELRGTIELTTITHSGS